MRGRISGWRLAVGVAVAGMTLGCQAEAGSAEGATALTAGPEAPHPPGTWVAVPGSQHAQWIDSASVTRDPAGVLTIRLLRETLGSWRIAAVEVNCERLEGRWRAEERWQGATKEGESPAPDATDDWIPSVPGGPRRVVFVEACRLAGVPTGPA